MTNDNFYAEQASAMIRSLKSMPYYEAAIARYAEQLIMIQTAAEGVHAVRYDKDGIPMQPHTRATPEAYIVRADTVRQRMQAVQGQLTELNAMLDAVPPTDRQAMIDKYVKGVPDLILEEQYGYTRQGLSRHIHSVVEAYCASKSGSM